VIIEEQDITWEIKKPVVEGSVSVVAAYPGVRAALTAQQRRIGLRGNVVMVGRDIGTVVLPDADLKIYLDASAEERARRRFSEMQSRGESADYAQILAKVIERDQIDSNREVAPLKPASDAVVINSSDMDIDAVLNFVLGLLK
jgi:cytidylate kinase